MNRAKACLEFRMSARKLEVHEHYKPFWPSPLRNVVAASDLPDPELLDDAPPHSPTVSDNTYSWETEYQSSRERSPTPERWDDADCDEDTAVKSDDPGCQEDTTEEAEASGMMDLGD